MRLINRYRPVVHLRHTGSRTRRYGSPIVALAISALLAACGNTSVNSSDDQARELNLESSRFGEQPKIISIAEIHELSDDQKLAFQRYFNDARNQHRVAHERVFDYLETVTNNFSYRGETYTAREALDNQSGNCLALAILTTALARLADVEIDYQLTDSVPVFESAGNHVRRSLHVRSMLYDPTWVARDGYLVMARPGIKVDYFPSDFDRFIGNIDESEYFAMYYRNIAADAIGERNLSKAYWHLMRSLELSPMSPEALNMLAVVNDRAGDKVKSEAIYKYGIQHATRRVSLLRNYGNFLRREGRVAEASEIEARLARLADPNPFDWLSAGQEAYGQGEFRRAISLFTKGVELAPYLHEGYFGLAKAHYRLGNVESAERELEQALSYASKPSARKMYEAKLASLSNIGPGERR